VRGVKTPTSNAAILVAMGLLSVGCEEEPTAPAKPAASAAVAQPAAAAQPAAPVASAPPPKDRDDCPEGSSGPGTFDKPCEGKGKTRLMEVTWTGKMTDTGPSFRVVNKSKLDIIYGKLAAYFYDKAGKQLDALESEESGKKRSQKWCAGKIFDGPMKAGEKAVITFSCVKKGNVPEGTAFVEGELQMVGFLDDAGEKTEFYWRNTDLTPDERPKGAK
jgi:hypothetical protein